MVSNLFFLMKIDGSLKKGTITDILKHTAKSNPDHKKLDEALKAIKEVMTYINEDKRKTEGQLAMFDIFNDIDNCPVSIQKLQTVQKTTL